MPGASSREKAATQFPPVSLACITTRMLSVPYPGHQPILANRILAVRVPDRRDVARRGAGERARITSAAADARAPAHDRRRGDNDPASPFSARLFRGSLSTTAASGRARRSPCAIAAAAGSRSSCDGSASTDGAVRQRSGDVPCGPPGRPLRRQRRRTTTGEEIRHFRKRLTSRCGEARFRASRSGNGTIRGRVRNARALSRSFGHLAALRGTCNRGCAQASRADHSQPYES